MRNTLRISPQDLPDFSPEPLSGLISSESTTMALLSKWVNGLVSGSHELREVTRTLETIAAENQALSEGLHDISSQVANIPQSAPHHPPQEQAAL